jgi:hypothetical protein
MHTPLDLIRPIFDQELVDACRQMKEVYSSDSGADFSVIESRIREVLGKIFEDYECTSVITTNNTDNIIFGVNVNPTITDSDLMNIIVGTDPVQLTRYAVEIDLKICINLTEVEIAAYLVDEVANTMDPGAIEKVRGLLDLLLADQDETIDIRQSVNYSQLLTFGIKDTLKKVSSLLSSADSQAVAEIQDNEYNKAFGTEEDLIAAKEKLRSVAYDDEQVTDAPKLSVLSWCLSVYKDVSTNYRLSEELLNKASACTGSVLDKREIDKTLKSLRRALSEIVTEAAQKFEMVTEGLSLFKSLKQSGLRSLEDDLYEYKIRLKNCDTQEDAMYILRQINTRISILEDYIANTDLSEGEVARWRSVAMAYRELRDELGKKRISKNKQWGVFVDYDAIDALEN